MTDALQQVTRYGYDEVGNRITQTDANNHTTKYAYDQRGRRVGRTLPMGQAESYAYDGNGNLFSRTDFNGHATTYTYDNLNRLLSKTADAFFVTNHLGAAAVSYTYNAQGQRATMTDASGTTTYTYDNRNRLVTKQTPEGTLSYTYDAAGDVKTIQSGNTGGASMSYGYDALNRLSTVTDASGATSYSYDNVGNLSGFAYPNGVAHSYGYDNRNRLTNLAVSGTVAGAPGAIASYAYTLDASGHRLSVAELSGRRVTYGYDNLYRLTSETIASDPSSVNGAVSYGYDPVGNRLQKTSTLPGMPGATSSFNANDQLNTDTYDNNGNTTASTGKGYSYDFENHLVQQAGITVVYDGDGNRVAKTTANGTTQYLVDDLNPTGYAQVMDEVQSGSAVRTYTWGLELISEHQFINATPTTSYYVFDGHGSVRALANASGAVTDTYDYDAFGNLLHSTGTTPNNYLYSGEQFDSDLGLYYNRARYLNTSTGRFWNMDEFEGHADDPYSLHRYLYAGDDPPNAFDKSGHEIDLVSTLGTAALIGGLAATTTSLYLGNGLWKSLGYGLAGAAAAFTLTAAVITGGAAVAAIFGVPAITGTQVVGGLVGSYFGALSIQRFLSAPGGKAKDVAAVGMIMALVPFFVPVAAGSPDSATEVDLINSIAARVNAGAGRNVGYIVSEIDGNSGLSYSVSGYAERPGTIGMPSNAKFSPDPGFEAHTEVKLLEDLATRITPQSQGRAVIIQRETYVCDSCQAVFQQFKAAFPGVSLEIRTAGSKLASTPFN